MEVGSSLCKIFFQKVLTSVWDPNILLTMKVPWKKPEKEPGKAQSKGSGKGLDNVWAAIRRITAQLDAVNAKLNIVQSMAMRTERKVYREDKAAPSDGDKEEVRAELHPGLFG